MRNARRWSLRFLGVCGGLALLTTCSLFGPDFEFLGKILDVDGQGHLEEDHTYIGEDEEYFFGASGLYRRTKYKYEAAGEDKDGDGITGEGTVVDYVQHGSYTWNPGTVTLALAMSAEADGDGSPVSLGDPFTDTFNAILTEHKLSGAYRLSAITPGLYEYRKDVEYASGDGSVTIESLEISGNQYDYFYSVTYSDSGGIYYGYEEQENGVFTITPEGAEIEPGATITMNRQPAYGESREWPFFAVEWGAWTELTYDEMTGSGIRPRSLPICFFDTYLVVEGVEQHRSIAEGF